MSGNTINNTITVGVTLGVAGYSNELTVTGEGEVKPNLNGTDGVDATSGTIVNYGRIIGSSGGDTGGIGIDIQSGSLNNSGTISGGASSYTGNLGAGGNGVEISEAIVSNSGLIVGGVGGDAYFSSEAGHSGAGIFETGGSMSNSGTIIGGAKVPRELVLINGNSYYVSSAAGAGANLTGGNFVNEGIIVGGYARGTGMQVEGGNFTNYGTVNGGIEGEGVTLSLGTILNNGSIVGGQHYAGAFLAGGLGGVYQSGGLFINDGFISGSDATDYAEGLTESRAGYGVDVTGGMLINLGTIAAGSGGVNNGFDTILGDVGIVVSNGTLMTGGLITGGVDGLGHQDDAVALRSSSAVIIVEPGAAFTGSVVGSGDNLIQLAAGTAETAGTLDMGGTFSGFGSIAFDIGAAWKIMGTTDELAAGQTINGFTVSDTIVLEGFVGTSDTYIPGIGLEISSGATNEMLDITGGFSTNSFLITGTGGDTDVELLCYLRGTRILTPAGEVAIENLAIGNAVVTRFGGYQKIKWIGRQSFARRFIETNRAQIPIRIAADALGSHLPKRDLYVSPGHSMLIGDILVLASSLINGVTVTQSECPDEVHYYQLEFERHDCVKAEGCWSESFCDFAGLRNQFHNLTEFWQLYPEHITSEQHLMCAPRPDTGPTLDAALRPVVARATARVSPGPLQGVVDEARHSGLIRGWALDVAHPELPVLLESYLGGRVLASFLACEYRPDLADAGLGRGRCAFTFRGAGIPRKSLPALRVRRAGIGDEILFASHSQTSTFDVGKPRRSA